MARVRKVTVQYIQYKGKRTPVLEKGYRYIAVLLEVLTDEQSEMHIHFLNGKSEKIIYDSFVSFAEDWNILKEYEFEKAYLPPTPR